MGRQPGEENRMKYICILGFANKETADRTLQQFEMTARGDAKVLILDNN